MSSGRVRSPKGLAQVVGAVLIFSFGVAMLTGFVYIFKSMKDKIVSDIRARTANEILEYVAVKAAMVQDMNATYATARFSIPETVGGESYVIYSDGGKMMTLSTHGFSANLTAQQDISGTIDSANGRAMITDVDGIITMRGVAD